MSEELQWLIMPSLIALPSVTVVMLFIAADDKRFIAPAFGLLLFTGAGMLFGWYGTAMYLMIQEAILGKSELFNSPIVRGAGIFISWASSLPLVYLFKRNIDSFRSGNALDRALLTFILFYGVHLVAACVFIIYRGGIAQV